MNRNLRITSESVFTTIATFLELEAIERNEREVDAALKRSEALRQSILKKAFTGRLAPGTPPPPPSPASARSGKLHRGSRK